mgnify:CR=1 FL=1
MMFYSKSQLKESRIFFEQQPTPLIYGIIGVIAAMTIGAFVFAFFVMKVDVVKGQGIVSTMDNHYISMNSNGTLAEILVEEGEWVEAGEVILKISNGQESLQIAALQAQIEHATQKLEKMDKYQYSLSQQTNLMANSGLEQEYYGYVDYYLSQVKSEAQGKMTILVSLAEKEKQRDRLVNELALLNMNPLENEALITSKSTEISGVESEIQSLLEQHQNPSSQAEQVLAQLIMELGKSRTSVESLLVDYKASLSVQQGQLATFTIHAPNSGTVHYVTPLVPGMSVQQNQIVAEVFNPSESNLLVEAYINAQDIGKVHLNDTVNVAISGINSLTYGTIPGQLIFIDAGTVSQETSQGSALLYRVKISISKITVQSHHDQIVLIKSMPVEARIVYQQETYLDWFLKLLNFTH